METNPIKRRLTAILAADAFGYSARMGEDEERTLRTLIGHRKLIDALIGAHDGRIVGTAGDSVLAEFASSVEAVRCAVEIQEALETRNDALPDAERLQFRIGINLGDVIVEGTDILGDGVNVASRLEGIAEPGGICVASSVFDQISGKLNLGFVDLGEQSLKNIARPVRAYRFARSGGVPTARPPARPGQRRGSLPGVVAMIVAALAAVYWFGVIDRRPPESAAAPVQPQPSTEETRLRLQIAEAERAKAEAELASVRAAASRQTAGAAPTASRVAAPPAPAPAAAKAAPPTPATASAAPGQAAPAGATAEGAPSVTPRAPAAAVRSPAAPPGIARGTAQARCEGEGDEPGFSVRVPVRVVNGEVVLVMGMPGRPGSVNLRGRPSDDGALVLRGFFVPRIGRNRGGQIPTSYEGRLVDGQGTVTGFQGRRSCSIELRLN